ncbi:M48 family metallopeptidase [Candidatus Omnitrophota bacterium]
MKKLSLIVCVIFLVGCQTIPISLRRQLSLVPQEQLVSLSETSYNEILATATKSESKSDTKMVVEVGKKIAASAEHFLSENGMADEIKHYSWEFNLIEDKQVNAFCLPGGKIVVYTGILPVAKDETGLAVVMGHEVAHAIANHGGERMSQELLVQLGANTIAEALNKNPTKAKALLYQVYGVGTQVGVLLPYSRLHETEADSIGLTLMAQAGYDPREAPKFWERMNALSKDSGYEFLSTHPAPENRITKITEELPKALEHYKK